MSTIRKATAIDLDAVEMIYNDAHDAIETGRITTGWIRGVYPTRDSAEASLKRDDLFVLEDGGEIRGTGIINQIQVGVYEGAPWEFEADKDAVCVFHTLVIRQDAAGRGYGGEFIRFYEDYARKHGWMELRMDTNALNLPARSIYSHMGYKEIAIVPTTFNGIPGVQLVLLEKHLE